MYETSKRWFDLLAASTALVLFSPLLLLLALIILAQSPGPVFYRATRTGLNGRPFIMFKFRTMVTNADKIGGPSTGLNDPRVTPIGRWLRRFKLDELPQLINVVCGDMSLVGPRPEVPQYTALYEGDEKLILTVRPGITDLASLEFSRLDQHLGQDNPDAVYENVIKPRKNKLRVQYARERCWSLDLSILVKTLLKIVRN
jgi:lipopolysaccharide/colanic/teichoic acid biosynthesis glycosyltransferase